MSLKGANYPTIRPSLDLRFAQNKTLDPRITFSRASVGTYYDVNGVLRTAPAGVARFDHNPTTGESLGLLLEEARTNNFSHSSTFESSAWTKQDLTVVPYSALAPDGTYTAAKLVPNTSNTTHRLQRVIGGNTPSRFSIYLKAGEYTICDMYSWNVDFAARINLADGSISTAPDIPKPSTGFSIQSIGNGWYRVTLYGRNDTTINNPVIIAPNSYGSFAGNNASGIYAWGAQLEDGTFSTSYIPTPATFTSRSTTATYYDANGVIQTAGVDVARSNAYLPNANGVMEPIGLLLEGAGTNLMLQSQDLSKYSAVGGPWTYTLTTNPTPEVFATYFDFSTTQISPDGTSTAPFVSIGDRGRITQSVTLGSTQTITLSFWARRHPSYSGGSCNAYIAQTGNDSVYDFAPLVRSDRWTRISYTRTMPAGTTLAGIYRLSNSGIYEGLYVWGFQVEASPYPTSYIPTTTTSVTRAADVSSSATMTRSADVAQITGSNFSSWYNQSEGSFLLHEKESYGTILALRFELNQNSSPNSNSIAFNVNYNNGTRISSRALNATGSIDRTLANAWALGGSHKYAYGLEEKNFSIVSGASVSSTALGAFPPNLDSLSLGATARSPSLSYNSGKVSISRLTYYPVRLPDATLQRLTT